MENIYNDLRKSFRFWKDVNKNKLVKDLNDYYNKNYIKEKLIKVSVINNRLYYNISHLLTFFKLRANIIIEMFKIAIQRLLANKIRLNNFVFYFTVNDYNISKTLPIFAFAKPINDVSILIPDWTFVNAYKNKIKGDWDSIMSTIKNTKTKIKNNIIYFQGSNTSAKKQDIVDTKYVNYKKDIRKSIETLSQSNPTFVINIDKPSESVLEWKQYKYVLDLPGAYPWSVRLKELFAMRSLVIKVDTKIRWVNFFSPLFEPNVDYVSITYDNNDSVEKIGKDVYEKLIKKYDYMENNPEYVERMISNGYNKINKLTMNNVIEYIILLLKLSSNLLSLSKINRKTNKILYRVSKTKKRN